MVEKSALHYDRKFKYPEQISETSREHHVTPEEYARQREKSK
jgi:hypothetical protein